MLGNHQYCEFIQIKHYFSAITAILASRFSHNRLFYFPEDCLIVKGCVNPVVAKFEDEEKIWWKFSQTSKSCSSYSARTELNIWLWGGYAIMFHDAEFF